MKKSILFGVLVIQLNAFGAEIQVRTMEPTANEITACIAEARADQDYYTSRLQGAHVLLEKAKGLVKLREIKYYRTLSLHNKAAVPKEQLEEDEALWEEAKLNVNLAQSIIGERSAEFRAAEARLTQANEGRCIRMPSH